MKKQNPKHEILSLFSGAGGLDYGFELTGRFSTKVCIESEEIFCETLRNNQARGYLKGSTVINESVTTASTESIRKEYFPNSPPAGIIGGPPCETFSVRGNKKGLDDHRGELIFTFLDWVLALKPQFFLMENVPPLARLNEGKVLSSLCDKATKGGYSVTHEILKASEYGAPTRRERLILIGINGNDPFVFPESTHSEEQDLFSKEPCVTVGDALKGLPPQCWESPGTPQGHLGIRHTTPVIERFKTLKQGQQDNIRKRTRLHLQRPSPTLVAGNLDQTRSHIHPLEPRELTNRESARLHGFPDSFEFAGNHAAMGKQIANSVPVALAKALAAALAQQLDNH
jgi:DNA (cytosine-5)-methyltransferase 1